MASVTIKEPKHARFILDQKVFVSIVINQGLIFFYKVFPPFPHIAHFFETA